MTSQDALKKLKLNSYGLVNLEPSQDQIADFTSSKLNGTSSYFASKEDNLRNLLEIKEGLAN